MTLSKFLSSNTVITEMPVRGRDIKRTGSFLMCEDGSKWFLGSENNVIPYKQYLSDNHVPPTGERRRNRD